MKKFNPNNRIYYSTNGEILSPLNLQQELKKLNFQLNINKQNVNIEALYYHIDDLLSEVNLHLFSKNNDIETKSNIVEELLKCCKLLSYSFIAQLESKLIRLSSFDIILMKKTKKFIRNKKISGTIIESKQYLISLVVLIILSFPIFLILRGFTENKIKEIEKDSKIIEFKNLYDFNVDSLKFDISTSNEKTHLKFPIIIYRKKGNGVTYDYNFNSSIDRDLISFKYDSINTIIVLENNLIDVGEYTDKKTKAKKIETIIHFMDKKIKKKIYSIKLTGGDPPKTIKYRRRYTEYVTGYAPTNNEIINVIKKELN